MNTGLIFAGLGFELAGLVVMSVYLGQQIDQAMKWQGYGTAGLLILGFIGWTFHLIVLLKRYQALQNQQEKPKS